MSWFRLLASSSINICEFKDGSINSHRAVPKPAIVVVVLRPRGLSIWKGIASILFLARNLVGEDDEYCKLFGVGSI